MGGERKEIRQRERVQVAGKDRWEADLVDGNKDDDEREMLEVRDMRDQSKKSWIKQARL